MHYTFLIACVLVAFFLGAILSGFLVSCYCSRSAALHTRKLSKDPEASLSHALSLRSLAKLSGLLDTPAKVGVCEDSERLHPQSSCFFSLLRRTNWRFPLHRCTARLSPTASRSLTCALMGSTARWRPTASSICHRYPDTDHHHHHHQRSPAPTSEPNTYGGSVDASVTPLVVSSLTG